jgi:hypothetical protein
MKIDKQHNTDLRVAQHKARQTGNSAAMLPAEAECYLAHIRTLVVAKAQSLADAHTAFNTPAGPEADREFFSFYIQTVAARKSAFEGQANLYNLRTKRSTAQVPFLLRGFERETRDALFEGQKILAIQRVQMTNKPAPPTPVQHITIHNNNHGDHGRFNSAGTDNSTTTIYSISNVFQQVRAELDNEAHVIDTDDRTELVSCLNQIELAPNNASAIERINLFVSLAANSATIALAIQPYIEPLKAWAHRLTS